MLAQSQASTSTASKDRKPKRKRVSRACDQCFLKKDRCDGVQPICTFCSQLGRACTYDRPERKRGPTQGLRPRLEQRIAALETVLGFVLQEAGETGLRVERVKSASEVEKVNWRTQGWWKSNTRKQLETLFGFQDDLVTSNTTLAKKQESEDDYSDVDLSLPPTHQPPEQPHPNTNHRRAADNDNNNNDDDDDDEISSAEDSDGHHLALPLLSSGKGGSSLNRGLVPRGADPNAALGGFEIEFGGNQTDIDWVQSFVPRPPRPSRPQKTSTAADGDESDAD